MLITCKLIDQYVRGKCAPHLIPAKEIVETSERLYTPVICTTYKTKLVDRMFRLAFPPAYFDAFLQLYLNR